MKHLVFLRASGAPADIRDHALAAGKSAPFEMSVNVVHDPDGTAPWHVVLEAWTDASTLANFLDARIASSLIGTRATYDVEELVEKDVGPGPGWPVTGVRLLVPWTRRSDVSPVECRRHWDEHVPLANRIHVGVTRYVRNWVTAIVAGETDAVPQYQGIASQHYASEQDLQERAFDTPASVQVIEEDVADFIVDPVVLLVTEYHCGKN